MERRALLPRYADIPTLLNQLVNSQIVLFAIFLTMQEQHICTLGLAYLDLVKFVLNYAAGVIDVFGKHLTQLVYPLMSFILIRSDKCVHGKNIH